MSRATELFYLAALLHDTGRLLLASQLPEVYNQVVEEQSNEKLELWQLEEKLFGVSHAEVSAYLLGLWRLPDIILEALAYHHKLSECLDQEFNPLTVVHACSQCHCT